MTPDEFRIAGHALIDWIADYREQVATHPVRAQVSPGWVREQLPTVPPANTDSLATLLSDLENIVVPGITQVQHPMHFGWFPSNAGLASVLGDIASSGLGTLGISWESCPALTEVEQVMCDWMRQLTGLSTAWHGTIQDTASSACLVALIAARERATELSASNSGLQAVPKPLTVYTTAQAHSSVVKAAMLAGFGRDNVRLVADTPGNHAMNVDALAADIERDRQNGCVPCAVVASIGSTGVTAIDPLSEITRIACQHRLWVHVDAAMAGSAMLLPECRWMWQGVEDADSVSWNPHKWMGTILDCSLFYIRDWQHLVRVMSTNPSYLQSNVDGQVVQYRDWGIPLGRRFRALKLWFQLRLEGIEAIKLRLRRDLDNAQWLAAQIRDASHWELVAPVPLQTVCARHNPGNLRGDALDAHTRRWTERINSSGQAFLSTAVIDNQLIARISVGVESTTASHVAKMWQVMQQAVCDCAAESR